MASALNSTACAVLGHLARRPWSAYELTKSLGRSLHWFWPRAESRIYDEARKLVSLGFATATTDRVGARRRTTYAATPAGRAALSAWLATEPETFAYHSEGLLRVHLAAFGTKQELLAAIEHVDATAEAILADAREVATVYAEGRHALQGDAHLRALVLDHLVSLATTLRAWARRTRHEVDFWDDLEPDDRKLREGIRRMTKAVEELPAARADRPAG